MLHDLVNVLNYAGKLSPKEMEEVLQLQENVKVWDVSPFIEWQDIKTHRPQMEETLKLFLLNEEAQIRSFFRPEDFLTFLISSTSTETLFLAHPTKARIDEYLRDSSAFKGDRIDLGPLEIVYTKLKAGDDKKNPKYHSSLDLPS